MTVFGIIDTLSALAGDVASLFYGILGALGVIAAVVIITKGRFTLTSILLGLGVGGAIVFMAVGGGLGWFGSQVGEELTGATGVPGAIQQASTGI